MAGTALCRSRKRQRHKGRGLWQERRQMAQLQVIPYLCSQGHHRPIYLLPTHTTLIRSLRGPRHRSAQPQQLRGERYLQQPHDSHRREGTVHQLPLLPELRHKEHALPHATILRRNNDCEQRRTEENRPQDRQYHLRRSISCMASNG